VRALKFASKFLVIVLVGGAALGGAVALLIPAGATLRGSVTPLGKLDLTINAPAGLSFGFG